MGSVTFITFGLGIFIFHLFSTGLFLKKHKGEEVKNPLFCIRENMITEKEINALINSAASHRYEYAIKRMVDEEQVWLIGNTSGIATYHDIDGNLLFPIWPKEEFAKICCIDEHTIYQPESLLLEDFIETYLDEFIKEGQQIVVFSLPTNKGVVVSAEQLKTDIFNELEKY